jgi:hypothetical protein
MKGAQDCLAHMGARTGLGGTPAQRIHEAPAWRLADREDCRSYLGCLDKARRRSQPCVGCAVCRDFVHLESHVSDPRRSNWTIEGA